MPDELMPTSFSIDASPLISPCPSRTSSQARAQRSIDGVEIPERRQAWPSRRNFSRDERATERADRGATARKRGRHSAEFARQINLPKLVPENNPTTVGHQNGTDRRLDDLSEAR